MMKAVTEATQVVRNESMPTGEIDGELVALDLERGSCFGMDRVGTAIWEMTANPVTVGEIADSLATTHEVERGQCLSDIVPFVEDLLSEGLLRQL
jgi:hypothetical protein